MYPFALQIGISDLVIILLTFWLACVNPSLR